MNNAAMRPEQSFPSMSFADWRSVLAVILDGAFLCSQACAPHIARAGGGSIINIGGETGHRGAAGRAHVVTAKAGLAGMTKALALDLAAQRITVNCVVPGRIDTVRTGSGNPAQAAHRPAVPPIGHLGTPRKWPRSCACCADPMHATSPDKRSTSTAAVTCRDDGAID